MARIGPEPVRANLDAKLQNMPARKAGMFVFGLSNARRGDNVGRRNSGA